MNAFEVFISTLLTSAIFLISYDIYLIKKSLPTISLETSLISKRLPIIAWALGLIVGTLAGHFWWPI